MIKARLEAMGVNVIDAQIISSADFYIGNADQFIGCVKKFGIANIYLDDSDKRCTYYFVHNNRVFCHGEEPE